MKSCAIWMIISLIFGSSSAFPSEKSMGCRLLTSTEGDADAILMNSVNVINGDLSIAETDLVVKAPDNLIVQRYYNSHDYVTNTKAGGWRIYPECLLVVGKDPKSKRCTIGKDVYDFAYAYTGDRSGGILCFSGWKNGFLPHDFKVDIAKHNVGAVNTSLAGREGRFNAKNKLLHFNPGTSFYELSSGDGRKRFYQKIENLPEDLFGPSVASLLTEKVKEAEYFHLISEILPSGNRVFYTYDSAGKLTEVQLSNSSAKILAFLTFNSQLSRGEGKIIVTSSDGRTIHYEFNHGNLAKVSISDRPDLAYHYSSQGLLCRQEYPDGHCALVEYDGQERVASLKNPFGAIATLFYYSNATCVLDALGHKKIYRYDEREQLVAIEYLDKDERAWKKERRFWGTDKQNIGNLLAKSIEEKNGAVIACTTYTYDENNNVVEERLHGNLTGLHKNPLSIDEKGSVLNEDQTDCQVKKSKYSKDGFNLLLWSGDEKENSIQYTYVANTSLLSSELFCRGSSENIKKRSFYFYNDDAVLIKKIVDDGSRTSFSQSQSCTERHITEIEPKKDLPGVGLPLLIEEKYWDEDNEQSSLLSKKSYRYDSGGRNIEIDLFDAAGSFCYSLYKEYDLHGNLIKETDPEGNPTFYTYDANDCCLSVDTPHQQYKKELSYDAEDRIIEEKESYGDQVFDSRICYDLLGRKISKTDRFGGLFHYFYNEEGNLEKVLEPETLDENDNRIQPEWQYSYDFLGHIVSTKDPKGYVTTIERNLRGDPLIITYPDGSQECFKYDPEGSLHRSRSKDGIVTSYAYDWQGRLESTDWSSIHEWGCGPWTYTHKQKHSAFHLDSKSERGMATEFKYDKAGRVDRVSQCCDDSDLLSCKKELSYDLMGHVACEKVWFSTGPKDFGIENFRYDHLNRVIETESRDSDGNLWTKRLFSYNAQGQRVEEKAVINGDEKSLGKITYNALGDPLSFLDNAGDEIKISYDYFYQSGSGQKGIRQIALDPKGMVAETIFDWQKRPLEIIIKDPSEKVLSHETKKYDLTGNLVLEIHDCLALDGTILGQSFIEREYGPMNRLESLTQFARTSQARKTLFSYDSYGRLYEKRLQGEKDPIVTYAFKLDGKIESMTWGKNNQQKFSYDENEHIKSAEYEKIRVDREYSAGGELLKETVYDEESEFEYSLRYSYDLKGRLTNICLPDESHIVYEYGPFSCKSIRRLSKEGKELYRHVYTDYDQLGHLQSEQMVGWAGNRIHDWGKRGKQEALLTDYLNLKILEGKRDNSGNICSILFENGQESHEKNYLYDALNRLIGEEGHRYSYDSLNHCLKRDNNDFKIDDRGQLISSLEESCAYDSLGYLTKKGSLQLAYDARGQLISAKRGEEDLATYTYDCFGRRIFKTTSAVDKKGNKKEVKKIYFYCGDMELGSLNDAGEIESLRVPGVINEALSLESVAIEIKKELFAPLHDFAGNVIALIDPNERQIVERYDYSAFGEMRFFDGENLSLNSSKIGNPWCYGEKRMDEESGLIFFGKRYYDPSLGQWISPDPAGFIDGPNLYAYAQNNPLSYLDAYGLSSSHRDNLENCQPNEHERYFFRERGDNSVRGGSLASKINEGTLSITYNDAFDEAYADQFEIEPVFQRHHFEPSREYDLGRPELPNGLTLMFLNGMNNNFGKARAKAELLSTLAGGYNIHCVYNATHGIPIDLYGCELNLRFVATPPVRLIHKMWDDALDRAPTESAILMICTSQGAIQVRDGLIDYPQEKRNRIIVVAIAPAAYIWKGLCKQAYHYVSPLDIVPRIDKAGRALAGDTVFVLPRDPSVHWYDMDHGMESLTYRGKLEDHLKEYVRLYGH